MNKFAVVYWSGTGNTAAMAEAIAAGINSAGAQAQLFTAGDFDASLLNDFAGVAFGCPSMGAEQLEDSEFEPMFLSCLSELSGRKLVLFGSYGWGDGEWMRNWEADCKQAGAELLQAGMICSGVPTEIDLEECQSLGVTLAK